LFIAQEIVTAHGGTIKVTSSAQSGTTFRVRVPLQVATTGTWSQIAHRE
jgi:signal transduction histidine kinase